MARLIENKSRVGTLPECGLAADANEMGVNESERNVRILSGKNAVLLIKPGLH